MPTKIRLQRKGKKGQPFYHLVIADGRAPRDGKFIERIGTYNPLTKPADINMDFDRALYWLHSGAQPTDTVRAILAYTGVLYKNHLNKGVKKGALTQEQADVKFAAWLKEKREKIENKSKQVEIDKKGDSKKRLEAEKKVNEARAEELAKKRAAELKAREKEAAAENAEEVVAEGPTESPAAEESAGDSLVAE
jgi:small subunit ribosomal protein S16